VIARDRVIAVIARDPVIGKPTQNLEAVFGRGLLAEC
jgi:hypothetical protein